MPPSATERRRRRRDKAVPVEWNHPGLRHRGLPLMRSHRGLWTRRVANGRPDAAARRDRRRGQDHQVVQVGRRRREAGRQPVRDRDRQGVDGGAVDHGRHAHRDQGAGRRDRAGRRRGRGDRGRGRRGRERRQRRRSRLQASAAPRRRRRPRRCAGRCREAARRIAAVRPARSVLRGSHAVAQFRPGENRGRHVRHAAGAPACRRERHRSVARQRLRPAWPHRCGRCRIRASRRAAAAPRRRRQPAWRRAGQGALSGRRVRGGAARRHARDHRAAAGRGQADHPAFLSHRRRDDGRAAQNPRGGQRRRAERMPRLRTSSRSTTSSSRRWRWRCSACRPPTRCGPATASCASSIPMSASRSRSTAAC